VTTAEINEAVARKLGDWEYVPASDGSDAYWRRPTLRDDKGRMIRPAEFPFLPDYATNIADAWDIVDHLVEKQDVWEVSIHMSGGGRQNGDWCVTITDNGEQHHYDADTAPLAICKAFLALEAK
jgi:hypothetical protein